MQLGTRLYLTAAVYEDLQNCGIFKCLVKF